ncbi:MAG: polysaccharide biosynthesis C-terminal domain-containing protein [Candidatus Cloacimonetes bacterium]|nr:polysaccharide biosynthesis C-terminal domain-containing protein [Candidatus Cloacimonadota bacterium]
MISNYLSKTLKYGLGKFTNQFLLFLLIPILTKYLIPEEYAVYSLLLIFISFASIIYFAGIHESLFSYFYDKKNNNYQFTLITTIYITLIFIGIIFSLLIIIFRYQISNLIFKTDLYANLFLAMSIIIFFDVIYGITLSLLNVMEKSSQYVYLSLSKNILLIILIIIGMINRSINIEFVIISMLTSSFVAVIYSGYFLRRTLRNLASEISHKILFSFNKLKKILNFGLPMIPCSLSLIILLLSDRYMLNFLLKENTLYNIGIYAVGYKIGMAISFFTSIFFLIYYPYAMKVSDKSDSKNIYRNFYKYFILFGTFFGSIVILFSFEIFSTLIDNAYLEGSRIVFFGVISHFLFGVFNTIIIVFYIKKKSIYLLLCSGSGALINIILNFILIPKYEIYGAGWASIIAYFTIVGFSFFAVQKTYYIGYRFSHILFSILALLMFAFLNYILPQNLIISLIKLGLLLIVLGIIFYNLILKQKYKLIIDNLKIG